MSKTIINDTNLTITDFKINKQNELEELQINGNEVSLGEDGPSTFTLYSWDYQDGVTFQVYTIYTQKRHPEVGDYFWACTGVMNSGNDFLAQFGQISAVDVDEDTVTVNSTPSGEYKYTFGKSAADITWNL